MEKSQQFYQENSRFTEATKAVEEAIDLYFNDLSLLNLQIHSNPELGYEEHQACTNIVSLLRRHDFTVTAPNYGLSTSFESTYGVNGRLVVFNAEYDALPGIGHACGHNLLTTASVAAFLAATHHFRNSRKPGRVRLLGTPAEEGGGGKIKLLAAGAFKGVDACLLTHPLPLTVKPLQGLGGIADPLTDATAKVSVTFTGKAAHPTLAPWQGRNALDAAVLAHNGVSMLRQQIAPDERVSGIISDGGKRTNIITDVASMEYQFRASSRAAVSALQARVESCFRGAALATGCEVSIAPGLAYDDMKINRPLCEEYAAAMKSLGSPVSCRFEDPASRVPASGDQGNVSYAVPAFHGGFGIETVPGAFNHTPGFAKASEMEDAFKRTLEAAKGMALVGIRVLEDEQFAERVWKDFEKVVHVVDRSFE